MNEVNFPKLPRINMQFLVNHMRQSLKQHTRKSYTKNNQSISADLINITPELLHYNNYCDFL